MAGDGTTGRAWIGTTTDVVRPRTGSTVIEIRLPHRWERLPAPPPASSRPTVAAHPDPAPPGPVAVAAPSELAHELAAVADPGPVIGRLVAAAVAAAGPAPLLAIRLPVPFSIERDDDLLARVLGAWPPTVRLALELADPSWDDDAVHALLRAHGVALVATDPGGDDAPVVRRIAPFLYVRLQGRTPDEASLDAWAARLEPFLADAVDAIVVVRAEAAAAGLIARLAVLAPAARSGGVARPA